MTHPFTHPVIKVKTFQPDENGEFELKLHVLGAGGPVMGPWTLLEEDGEPLSVCSSFHLL